MKTLILAALSEELEGIKAATVNTKSVRAGAYELIEGDIANSRVLLCLMGVGKVNAASAASSILTAIDGIDTVINTGVAGGIGEGLKRGDIALGIKTVQYDVDSTADGLKKGQVQGFDSEYFECNESAVMLMERALKDENLAYRKGVIASGDRFVADKNIARGIADDFNAIACDMESAAIAQVCKVFGVPFLVMRAISDSGDDLAIESFYEFLHKAADRNVAAIKRYMLLKNV